MNLPDIPSIADGTSLPPGVALQIQREKERQEQMNDIKRIADSAESQAKSSAIQAEIAVKTSKKADVKGWIAVVISVITLFFEFVVNRAEIMEYVNQILQSIQSK